MFRAADECVRGAPWAGLQLPARSTAPQASGRGPGARRSGARGSAAGRAPLEFHNQSMPVRPLRSAPRRAAVAPVHRGPGASTSHGVQGAPNAALLIDFDNVTLGIRSDLQSELRNLLSSDIVKGKVAVQRAYADWRRYPQYIVPLSESSIDLIFAPAYGSSKKNATDIRLAVDAIELVFTRPEIGTFILLSGDSDFSSLVLKLKEYGKYVIGVGIRESSSDLLVQNCDEYYSYNALAGLKKTSEEEHVRKDPWELVVEAIERMQRNGDVMRADRLKQVMQEIDPNFDEGDIGYPKFSKFCQEAAQRGLIRVTKLENGQLEVAPVSLESAVSAATTSLAHAATPGEDREPREVRGRDRRGRRGRGRDRERADGARAEAAPGAIAEPPTSPPVMDGAEQAPAAGGEGAMRDEIGGGGQRLTRDEAFDALRRALNGHGDEAVSADSMRARVRDLLGRDSESLNPKMFARILRDAHDAGVVDLRKRGDSFEVAKAASAPPVADQLGEHARAAAAAAPEAAAAPASRSIIGRRTGRGRAVAPPPDLLSVGVVELDQPPPNTTEAPEKKPARKRSGRKKTAAKSKART
jgi:uncharacterized protein (TIGR00288 family)